MEENRRRLREEAPFAAGLRLALSALLARNWKEIARRQTNSRTE